MAQVNPISIDLFTETVIVGTSPDCLFDASDATYVEAVSSVGVGSSVQILMGAATIASLAAIPLFVRAMYRLASGSPPSTIGMTVNAFNDSTGDTYGFFSSNVAYGYQFAATDVAYDITDWTWNEDHTGATADLVTALAAGQLRLRFDSRIADLSDSGLRIIECYLIGATVNAAPLRLYPGGGSSLRQVRRRGSPRITY